MDFVKLKMLCEFEKGSTGLAKAEPGEYPLVATGAKRKTCNAYQFDTKAVCIPLVSSTGHGHASLKNVHYQEGKFALGSILVALTSKDDNKLNIQFLHLYLSQLKDEVLVPLMSGAANVALSVKKIQDIEIPLPSIERQREIVERFKSIVIEEDELKAELTHQQTLLKKLRQQIFQEAIEGKLTADWRAQNLDVVPARELLKRIAAEKAQLVKDKKIKAPKPLPLITEEEKPFELPQGWEWCRLEESGLFERGKSKHRPRNDPRLFVDGYFPFVQTGDVARSKKNSYKVSTFSQRYNEFGLAQSRVWSKGTLCITIAANIAETGFLDLDACFPDSVVGFSPISDLTDPFYVKYFIDATKDEIEKFAPATAQKNINLGIINMLSFPLPPHDEQKAIVVKVERLFALCDQLEIQISQNQIHADLLMRAVLKEAFNHSPEKKEPVGVQPLDNIVPFKPKCADYYKRTLLAAEIVHQLHKEPTLGHLKLQKLIYLCQKTESMQLPTQFLKQVAGPYDNRMARSIDKQLKDKKWFSYNRDQVPKYTPLERASEHQTDFDKYFAPQKNGIHALIRLFRKEKYDQLEIVATLYACWEDILKKQEPLSEELLVQRFYEWSEEKRKYEASRIHKAIEWMRNKNIVPDPEKIAHA